MDGWFVFPRQGQPGALRLVCLAHAGGSAETWLPLARALPDVELVAVQLPGRGRRLEEPPFSRLPPLVDALVAAMATMVDRPFALLGHSLGALVAVELARRLSDCPALLGVVVSGERPARLRALRPPVHALPDADLLDELRRLGGTLEEVLRDRELVEMLLPALRGDLAVSETWRDACAGTPPAPLGVPLVVFGGTADPDTPVEDLGRWAEETTGGCEVHVLPGGHFFLQEDRGAFAARLAGALGRLAAVGAWTEVGARSPTERRI